MNRYILNGIGLAVIVAVLGLAYYGAYFLQQVGDAAQQAASALAR